MPVRNTIDRFGILARGFHWLTFLLLIASFTLAYSMAAPGVSLVPRTPWVHTWHTWVGITVFLLVLMRLGWRLVNPPPRPPAGMPLWQRRLAAPSHASLYAILIVMPLTGWAMSTASNNHVVYLGLVHLPGLIGVDRELGDTLKAVHRALSIALLALVAMHVLAALYHHVILRDDVLRRMLPWPTRARKSTADG